MYSKPAHLAPVKDREVVTLVGDPAGEGREVHYLYVGRECGATRTRRPLAGVGEGSP